MKSEEFRAYKKAVYWESGGGKIRSNEAAGKQKAEGILCVCRVFSLTDNEVGADFYPSVDIWEEKLYNNSVA